MAVSNIFGEYADREAIKAQTILTTANIQWRFMRCKFKVENFGDSFSSNSQRS